MKPLSDIGSSLLRVRIWMSLAISDVAGKYRRTVLGPLWIVLGQVAVIIGIYLLRHSISPSVIGNFLLYLAASLPIWGLISSMTSDGTAALSRSKSLIESYALPMTVFLLRSIASSYITFLHTIVVFFIVAAFYWEFPTPQSLPWFFLGLGIVMVFGLGMHLLLAPLSARYRDIAPALASFMTVAYIMSPVFWVVAPDQQNMLLVKFNPFYYLLDITRGPLLNQVPSPSTYYVAAFIALVALYLGIVTFRRLGPRVVYWI